MEGWEGGGWGKDGGVEGKDGGGDQTTPQFIVFF